MSSFYLFPLLPPELRRTIYLLATPPRLVKVRESPYPSDSLRDSFLETLSSDFSLKLNPSLPYFAHNWRKGWPRTKDGTFGLPPGAPPLRQTRLKGFGFSTSSVPPQKQPWESSEGVPDVDLVDLESCHPKLVWEACRISKLTSDTPPPPFLSVCRESRQTLMAYGYELVFGTWSSPATTWFCFRRDIIVLDKVAGRLLDPSQSNLGQFDPKDLVRLKRVALDGDLTLERYWYSLSMALRLMPNVSELFLVGLQMDDVPEREWRQLGIGSDRITAAKAQLSGKGINWEYVTCQSDELSLWWNWPNWYDYKGQFHSRPTSEMPTPDRYFDHIVARLPAALAEMRDFQVRHRESVAWNVPTIELIHLGSPQYLEFFIQAKQQMRRRRW